MKHTFDNLIDSKTGKQLEIEVDESSIADFHEAMSTGHKAGEQLKKMMTMEPTEERFGGDLFIGSSTRARLDELSARSKKGKMSHDETVETLTYLIEFFDKVNNTLDYLFSKHNEASIKFNDSQKFDKE